MAGARTSFFNNIYENGLARARSRRVLPYSADGQIYDNIFKKSLEESVRKLPLLLLKFAVQVI